MTSNRNRPLDVARVLAPLLLLAPLGAATAAGEEAVTFTKHIAPILQENCQSCHRPQLDGADVADDIRGSAPLGAEHQVPHRAPQPHGA